MTKLKSDALKDILDSDDGSKYKNKKSGCGCAPSPKKSHGCKGNNCCGNAACVVASCDPCDVACVNEAQNLVITSRRFIPTPIIPTGATTLTFPEQNFYVQLPEKCATGPVQIVWSVANTILNFVSAANILAILTGNPTLDSISVTIKLNILAQRSVFDVAKVPASQSNGFGNFGYCSCRDIAVTYSLLLTFTLDPSTGLIVGTVQIINSAGNPILIGTLTFTIAANNSSITILADDLVVSPAVVLLFTESVTNDSKGGFWSLLDQSTLFA